MFTMDTTVFNSPYCSLSTLTALHLVESYFPQEGRVLDIGGGTGTYALELAQRGYEVTLVDDDPIKLELALASFYEARIALEAIIETEAKRMPMLQSDSYDAAVLDGPLFSALTAGSRAAILGEIYRLLKPSGVAIVSYLNSWGLLKRTVTDFSYVANSPDNIYALYDAGVHGPWYWATPPVALRELRSLGFNVISYAAAEGYLAGVRDELNTLEDEDRLANIITTAVETSEHPAVRSMGEHLHFVIEKP